jgi:hypothetical protein
MHTEFDPWYKIKNSRHSRPGSATASELISEFRERIVAVNAMDIQLYDYVRNVLVPRQDQKLGCIKQDISRGLLPRRLHERWRDTRRHLQYRLYRNLVYKPHVGRLPLPHRLPIYETKRRAA